MNIPESSLTLEYEHIFAQRGSLYHRAMASEPTARDAEFSAIFQCLPLSDGEYLIDVPSGGGYLEAFIRRTLRFPSFAMANLEFSPGFSPMPRLVDPYSPWPTDVGLADRLICLAASHHIENLDLMLNNCLAALRPGGILHLADVPPCSGISSFLETFVHRFTSTGHRGIYREFSAYPWPSFLDVISVDRRSCPWRFADIQSMLSFCISLFGLHPASEQLLEQALRDMIGVRATDTGVELLWELSYIDLRHIA